MNIKWSRQCSVVLSAVFLIGGSFLSPNVNGQKIAEGDEAEAEVEGFKLVGMKCYSDKIQNKIESGKGGFKIEGGFKLGGGKGSEISDFTFPEDQLKQYFDFQFGPGSGGKTIDVVLETVKSTAGVGLEVVSLSGKTDGEGKLPAEWNMKKNWPVGTYRASFSCEGKSVGTGTYLVKAVADRESPIKPKELKTYAVKEGERVEKTKLTPGDNSLVFSLATEGAATKGAKVNMFLGYMDDKGEKQVIPDAAVEIEDWPLEDTVLVYTFELPKELPEGKYFMVYLVNDEILLEHEFDVAAE